MDYGKKPFRRVRLDAMADLQGSKARLRFQTRMASLLREEGIAALREAKCPTTLWRPSIIPMWTLTVCGPWRHWRRGGC